MNEIIRKVLKRTYVPSEAKTTYNLIPVYNLLDLFDQTRGILSNVCPQLTWKPDDPLIWATYRPNSCNREYMRFFNRKIVYSKNCTLQSLVIIKITPEELNQLKEQFEAKISIKQYDSATEETTYKFYPDNQGFKTKPLRVVIHLCRFEYCLKDWSEYSLRQEHHKCSLDYHIHKHFAQKEDWVACITVEFEKNIELASEIAIKNANLSNFSFQITDRIKWNYFYLSDNEFEEQLDVFKKKDLTCDNFYDHCYKFPELPHYVKSGNQYFNRPRYNLENVRGYSWTTSQLRKALFKDGKLPHLKSLDTKLIYPTESKLFLKNFRNLEQCDLKRAGFLVRMFDSICQLRQKNVPKEEMEIIIKQQRKIRAKIQKKKQAQNKIRQTTKRKFKNYQKNIAKTRKRIQRMCINDKDVISQDTLGPFQASQIISFIPFGKQKGICYLKKDLLKLLNTKTPLALWVKRHDALSIDVSGHGGQPSLDPRDRVYILPADGTVINQAGFELLNQSTSQKFQLAPILENQRIGNLRGSFGESQHHGQLPGFTIYDLVEIPNKSSEHMSNSGSKSESNPAIRQREEQLKTFASIGLPDLSNRGLTGLNPTLIRQALSINKKLRDAFMNPNKPTSSITVNIDSPDLLDKYQTSIGDHPLVSIRGHTLKLKFDTAATTSTASTATIDSSDS